MNMKMNNVKFIPLSDRVLIKVSVPEKRTASGILIPGDSVEKPLEGYIVAVGDEVLKVKVGYFVAFGRFVGVDIKINEESYLIMRQSDIYGIL